MISIKDSSEPFRAFLGSILSIIEGEPVEPSQFDPSMQLDTIMEDTDDGPLPEDDIDDGSGVYVGSSSTSNPPMMTCSQAAHENINPGLMVVHSLAIICCLADSSSLRLLPLPPTRLNHSNYGCILMPCRTTHLPFRCLIGMT
jgi:hypothetical protein